MKKYDRKLSVVFDSGTCTTGKLIYVTCTCPDADADDEEFSRQFFYDCDDSDWGYWHDVPQIVNGLQWIPDSAQFTLLSEEGFIGYASEDSIKWHKIPGAGVHSDGAMNWGYLNRLRYLHGTLYAIGNSGQVYQRLGTDRWAHMDEGMLQSPITADRDSREMVNLNDIGGSSATDLYACGDYGHLFHWDGQRWMRLALQDHISHLEEIAVVSAQEIYICGYNGCLLKGNAKEGFIDISAVDVNVAFLSLRWFNGTLFLAAAEGLFAFDGQRIVSYETDLKPDLQGAHQLDAADGILWSFGYKDLAYFDGNTWTRVDHPDNPPIR